MIPIDDLYVLALYCRAIGRRFSIFSGDHPGETFVAASLYQVEVSCDCCLLDFGDETGK